MSRRPQVSLYIVNICVLICCDRRPLTITIDSYLVSFFFFSGFVGAWTEQPLKFDNSYFKEMLAKEYADETTAQGCPQKKHGSSGTIMLISDLALLESPFKEYVELYAKDQDAFFKDYTAAWVKLQENGCSGLRDSL